MNENVSARKFVDKFYPVSVLDVEGVRDVAVKEKVDFVITVCADQVLEVVAKVSEELGLPCYIDYATAENVSKKSYMKKIFCEHGIPTSQYVILNKLDESKIKHLEYPLIVKPVDAYSSRGVCKVNSFEELKPAFENAVAISRAKNAIVEEGLRNAGLEEAETEVKMAGRNVNNLRYADDTTLMAESEKLKAS